MLSYLDSQEVLDDVLLSSSDEEDHIILEDEISDVSDLVGLLEEEEKSEPPLLTALRSHSLEKKTIFRLFPSGKPIPIKDYYTELAVVERQHHVEQVTKETTSSVEEALRPLQIYESIYQPSSTIAMKDLFNSEKKATDKKSTFTPKRIILVGRAGVGKTTLCSKLVYDFYQEGLWPEKDFAAIVHIPLRELINKSVTSLGAAIREFCLLQRDEQHLSIEVINDTLADENIRDKILYVLDGYDEIAPHLMNNPLLNDLLTSFSEEAHWIITSRPLAIPGSVFDEACDRRVENIGFSTEQVYQFVSCYFNGDEERDERKTARLRIGEALAAEIRQNVNLQGIMHVPINSQLVCYVYEQELISINSSRKGTPPQWQDLTMTRLYDKLVYQLVRRYLLRCYETEKDEQEKQRIQSFYEGRSAEKVLAIPEVKQLFDFLESVAWLVMENKDILFSFNESKNKSLYDVLKKTSEVHYRRLCLPEKKQQQFEWVLLRIREKIRRGEAVTEKNFKALGTLVTQRPALYSDLESLYESDEDFKDLDPFETFFIDLDLPSDKESTAAMMTLMQNFIRIITQELGLLTNTGEQASVFSEENAYYFLHLTFQEYFAARYMVSHWEEKEVQMFIVKHRYEPRYHQMLGFVAGLCVDKSELLNNFFQCLLYESKEQGITRDLVGHYEQLLLLHCLEESYECKALRGKDDLIRSLAQWINQLVCSANYKGNEALQHQLAVSRNLLKEPMIINGIIAPLLSNQYPDEIKKYIFNNNIANIPMNRDFFEELYRILQQENNGVSDTLKVCLAWRLSRKMEQDNASAAVIDRLLELLKSPPTWMSPQVQIALSQGFEWNLRYTRFSEALSWKVWELLQSPPPTMLLDVQLVLAQGLGENVSKGCVSDELTERVLVLLKELPKEILPEVRLALIYGLGLGLPHGRQSGKVMQNVVNFLRLSSWEKLLNAQLALANGLIESLKYGCKDDELMENILDFLQFPGTQNSVEVRLILARGLGEGLYYTHRREDLLRKAWKWVQLSPSGMLSGVQLTLVNSLGRGLIDNVNLSEELLQIVWQFLQCSQGLVWSEVLIKLAKGLGEHLCDDCKSDALMKNVLDALQSPPCAMLPELQLALAEGLKEGLSSGESSDVLLQTVWRLIQSPRWSILPKVQLVLAEGLGENLLRGRMNSELMRRVLIFLESSQSNRLLNVQRWLAKGLGKTLFVDLSEELLWIVWNFLQSPQSFMLLDVRRELANGLGVAVCTSCSCKKLLQTVFEFLQTSPVNNMMSIVQLALVHGLGLGLMYSTPSNALLQAMLNFLQKKPLWIPTEKLQRLTQDLRKALCRSPLPFLLTHLKEGDEFSYPYILPAILGKTLENNSAIWVSERKIHFIENNTQYEIEMPWCLVNKLCNYLTRQSGISAMKSYFVRDGQDDESKGEAPSCLSLITHSQFFKQPSLRDLMTRAAEGTKNTPNFL